MARRILTVLILTLLCVTVFASAEDLRGYDKNAGGYQYVLAGKYPYEADGTEAPVLWRVLSVNDGEALLLTEMLIDAKQVTFSDDPVVLEKHTYPNLSSFAESDLSHWLNSDMLSVMFENDPLVDALVEKEQGRVSILTQAQLTDTALGFVKAIYTNTRIKVRQAYPTPYAKACGIYVDRSFGSAAWWTSELQKKLKCNIVGVDGHISNNFYTRKKVGVRPAITLDLSKVNVASGTGTKDDPYILEYAHPTAFNAGYLQIAEATVSDAFVFEKEPQKAEQKKTDDNTLLLSFIGDISIDATQSRVSPICLTNVIREKGYAWPFSLLSDYLQNDDYTFANLEVVLTEREKLKSSKMYNMIAPPDFVNILIEGGIDVVNTVNNHCFDFEEAGYKDTLKTLDEAGVNHFGTIYPGMKQESDILGVAEVKGVKIGMVGMSYPTQNTDPNKNRDLKRYKQRIEILKNEMGCQLVICSVHWGHEGYMNKIDNWQFRFARELIDAGADAVWGHHPHVLQPVYFYKGKPVMFSTGNILFGLIANNINPATGIFQLHYDLSGETPVLTEFSLVPCETGKRGDYRTFELTEEKDRKTCWKYLTTKKGSNKLENLPASFAETGHIMIAPDGTLNDDE